MTRDRAPGEDATRDHLTALLSRHQRLLDRGAVLLCCVTIAAGYWAHHGGHISDTTYSVTAGGLFVLVVLWATLRPYLDTLGGIDR